MKARSFSHVGITVSDFNRFVRFYSDVFGCRLVGVQPVSGGAERSGQPAGHAFTPRFGVADGEPLRAAG